jgi:hypothetical protein
LGGALAANEDKIQEAVVAEVVNAFRKQAAIDEIIKKGPPGGFAFRRNAVEAAANQIREVWLIAHTRKSGAGSEIRWPGGSDCIFVSAQNQRKIASNVRPGSLYGTAS